MENITLQPHEVQQQLTSLGHNVATLMSLMAKNERTPEIIADATRTYQHIYIVSEYPWFANYDMTFYRNVASQGQAWVNGA